MGGRGSNAPRISGGAKGLKVDFDKLNITPFHNGSLGNESLESSIDSIGVDLMYKFPEFQNAGGVKIYEAKSGELKERVYAFVIDGEDTVYINKDKFNNRDKLYRSYENDVKSGYHPKGTDAGDIVAHEYGHVAHNLIMKKYKEGDVFEGKKITSKSSIPSIIVESVNTSLNKQEKKKLSWKDRALNISRYAGENYHETIAESFADVYANGKKANSFSQGIVNVIRRNLK